MTTTTTGFPDWYSGYMQDALARARGIAGTPFQAYGGQSTIGLNPYLSQGMDMIAKQAQAGSPLLNQASQVVGDTMSGKYLQGNPYLDAMAAQTRQNVSSDINKQFGVNAWGGSAQQELLSKGMAQAENAMRYNDYANERQRQLQAANYAPQLAQQMYMPADMLNKIGTQLHGLNYNEYMRGQNWPLQMNQSYINALGLRPGGTQSTSSPDPSRMSSVLGGAMGGAALGRMAAPWLEDAFGWGSGASTAAGAGIGGILGAFF